ncbi:riboflavin synthase [Helicobacter valdiviensis]|uniref:Riboflavin synthase n=1 Tax=Helicobacter valdiviensis TaxID=1458358 RepID=A0A2W6NJE6_9HELI|nr:riboflavin synthase [Helicobacter valdiviensis]PZT47496.1 riboflavin synthase [Helicobacter valdiviensis]
MFTGLIREFAKVQSLQNNLLVLEATYKPKIGDSIAVNGACLTAVEIHAKGFSLELSEETQNKIAIENYKDLVHIEPALMLSDRLDGHIVQGHIDGIGIISKIVPHSIGTDFYISLNSELLELCIPKGSIAINGVSLTINEVLEDKIRLTIIPHTLKQTLFTRYQEDWRVNIETDMFARMLKHFLDNKNKNKLSWESIDKILGSY